MPGTRASVAVPGWSPRGRTWPTQRSTRRRKGTPPGRVRPARLQDKTRTRPGTAVRLDFPRWWAVCRLSEVTGVYTALPSTQPTAEGSAPAPTQIDEHEHDDPHVLVESHVVITTDTYPIASRARGVGWVAWFALALRERARLGGKCQKAPWCCGALVMKVRSSCPPMRQTHGRLSLGVKHINDARSLVMMPYDQIEPMIWERF